RDRVAATWNLDNQMRCTAIAIYIFTNHDPGFDICKQCLSSRSRGPAIQCHRPGMPYMDGACTNCYYSGYGAQCSFRQGISQYCFSILVHTDWF
ncbi:hypothetical protein C8A03DRAFT_18577, partial [Achaetomium macrosporum]